MVKSRASGVRWAWLSVLPITASLRALCKVLTSLSLSYFHLGSGGEDNNPCKRLLDMLLHHLREISRIRQICREERD